MEVYFTTIAGGAITGYPAGGFTSALTTLQYAFSGNILINDVNQGSGRGDLRYDIPINNGASRSITIPPGCFYGSATCTTYFVLYSQWGFPSGPSATLKPRSATGPISEWSEALKPVAAYPNIYCKLSGLVTEANWSTWTTSDLRPFGETLDPERRTRGVRSDAGFIWDVNFQRLPLQRAHQFSCLLRVIEHL